MWNPAENKFEMDPNPKKVRWILSNLNLTLVFVLIPAYVMSTRTATLNSSQIVFLSLEMVVAIHSVPLFLMAAVAGSELSKARFVSTLGSR